MAVVPGGIDKDIQPHFLVRKRSAVEPVNAKRT